jgi:GntR family transcriptional regulator
MRYLSEKREILPIDCRMDRQSFVPLYQQIKNWLLDKIETGQLSKGDVIPSEAQFSEVLKVSRATIRQAFYELRLEGYIVREKGRGTFIGLPERAIHLPAND